MSVTLVLGGARSGKSRYAENLLRGCPSVTYCAPGLVPDGSDPEWAERISWHQANRPAGSTLPSTTPVTASPWLSPGAFSTCPVAPWSPTGDGHLMFDGPSCRWPACCCSGAGRSVRCLCRLRWPQGLGATVAGSVPRGIVAFGFVLLFGVSALTSHTSGSTWWIGPVVVSGAMVRGVAVIGRATRRLGGTTGDVLGAVIEVSLATALTAAAVLVTVAR